MTTKLMAKLPAACAVAAFLAIVPGAGAGNGACCLEADPACVTVASEAACTSLGGTYAGDGVDCLDADCPCFLDLDGDDERGFTDLLIILANWGVCPDPPAECVADINGDGQVATFDLLAFLTGFGEPCT